MPSAEDQLRLIAEVVFNDKGARDLDSWLKKTHTEGEKHSKEQARQSDILQRNVRDTTRLLKEGMAPALSAIGIGTVSLASAVAALGGAAFKTADYVKQIDIVRRQTGFAMRDIQGMEELGKKVNIQPAQMDAALTQFADNLERFKSRGGPLWDYIIDKKPLMESGMFRDLQAAKGPMEGLVKLLEDTAKLPLNIRDTFRRELLGAAGLPGVFSQLGGDIQKEVDEITARQHQFTDDEVAQAARFDKAWRDSALSFGKLSSEIGLFLQGPGKNLADWLDRQSVITHASAAF
jgi:hypothetical protein